MNSVTDTGAIHVAENDVTIDNTKADGFQGASVLKNSGTEGSRGMLSGSVKKTKSNGATGVETRTEVGTASSGRANKSVRSSVLRRTVRREVKQASGMYPNLTLCLCSYLSYLFCLLLFFTQCPY